LLNWQKIRSANQKSRSTKNTQHFYQRDFFSPSLQVGKELASGKMTQPIRAQADPNTTQPTNKMNWLIEKTL